MTVASSPPRQEEITRRGWLVVLVLAVVVRAAVLLVGFSALADDPDHYRAFAENLLRHGTYGFDEQPTAYRPPLWPLALVPCVAGGQAVELRIACLQFALGVGAVVLVWCLAARCVSGRSALVAPLLVAIDPILLRQSTLAMTETLAAFLTALALVTLDNLSRKLNWRRALGAGAVVGLACLCRPTFLPWLALLPLVHFVTVGRERGAWRFGVCALLAGAVVLLPWVIRNAREFHTLVVGTTHGGYTLLLGNNASFYDYARAGRWGAAWDATSFHERLARELPPWTSPEAELERDRAARDMALRNIEEAPSGFLRSAFFRIGYLFALLPHNVGDMQSAARAWIRYGIGIFYIAEFALAAVGIVQLRARLLGSPWAWCLSLVACFAIVHLFFWTDMRMRAPLAPAIALAAAAGWAALADRVRGS